MFRVLLVVAWIGVVVYALADWVRTPEDSQPGKLPRMLWLLVILLTAPTFALGAIAWIVARVVMAAESGQGPRPLLADLPGLRPSAPPAPSGPVAPDDDPEFLFKLQRDIQRQRAQEGSSKKPSRDVDADTDAAPSTGAAQDAPGDDTDSDPDPGNG